MMPSRSPGLAPRHLIPWILITLAVTGCSVMFGPKKSSRVRAVYSVVGTETRAAMARMPAAARVLATTLGPGERISFTPTSLKIRVKGLYLAREMEYVPAAGGLAVPLGARSVSVTSASHEIQLAGHDAFREIYSISAEVPEELFGSYRGILLLYGIDTSPGEFGHSDLLVSGTVEIGGVLHTFADIAVPMETSGIGLNMAQAVTIAEGSNPVVQILFDVENAAHLTRQPAGGGYAAIPGTDFGVAIANLPFLPYVGAGRPVVEKYEVTLDSEDFGPSDRWHLKVLVFRDNGGDLVAVGWQTVYLPGYRDNPWPFEPGLLYIPDIVRTGDSYDIKGADGLSFGPPRLRFPAFRLESHTGTLQFDGREYAYSAAKQ